MATGTKKKLVIVESPAKARTIARYLGNDYQVAASVGHVRDLPKKELGVDVEHGFEPAYVTIRGKTKILKELKQKASDASKVILATDPDREGEAIAFHVAEQLGLEKDEGRFERVTFREVTRGAVQEALAHPSKIDMKKVEAQQARRILDRLVGYQVSPFLWKPIRPGLSAGRVQTVALRLICEREDEIRAFKEVEYWSITAHLVKEEQPFDAKLHKISGKTFTLCSEAETTRVIDDLEGKEFRASEVKRRERSKNPPPPFTTSTLQQAAAKRFGFGAKRTMGIAQRLYEGVDLGKRGAEGLITYMRTDSTRVSGVAVGAAREWIGREIGDAFVAPTPRLFGGKQQKGAQEAHEAIRPTNVELHPQEISGFVSAEDAKLYELIWLRFVASQMAAALYDTTTLDFDLSGGSGTSYLFRATGSVVKFPGFTHLYREAKEKGDHRGLDDLEPLPALEQGDVSDLQRLEPKQHFTQPPPRFSEASLVRELEKLGIGRPSTYAQIISTIQDRGYVEIEQKRFHPTDLGDTVRRLLVRVFPNLFNVEFTSDMERALDEVEEGVKEWRGVLESFYPEFQKRLAESQANTDEIIREILAAEGETCQLCGQPMLVRWNKRGRFLGCSGYPDCKTTRSLDQDQASEARILGPDPETGETILARVGPYGPYLQVGEGQDGEKPKRVSLPEGSDPDSVDLEYALKLLALPRALGSDPTTGKEVTAGLGRYGPYVQRGGTYRNLPNVDQLFQVSLEEALTLLNASQGRATLRELGAHPQSGEEMKVLDGRYGPYVTDGSVNASLPKGSDPEDITVEEAVELLAKAALRKKSKKKSKGGGGRRRKSS